MPSYVVETFVPAGSRERFAIAVDELLAASERIGGDLRVRLVRSYLVPADEMGFHVVEAGTPGDVERVVTDAGIDPERIVEVVRVEGAPMEGTG
jgi:hypothetical protein